MKLHKILQLIPLVLILCGSQQAEASHLYATEITYRCLNNNQYIVQLEAFQDCGAIAAPSIVSIQVNSSCTGTQSFFLPQISLTDISPVCPGGTSPCLSVSYGTSHVVYSDTINFPSCSDWVISYDNCCRSSNTTNLVNAMSGIYTHTTLNNSSTCNNTALSNNTAYIYSNIGLTQTHSINAYDLDGDSLVFIQTEPLGSSGNSEAYLAPHSIAHPLGTSSSFSLNSSTGDIVFTANTLGLYVVGIRVEEYRNGLLIASSNKDINIRVLSGSNSTPNYTVSNVQGGYLEDNIFYVNDPNQLSFDITAIDTADVNDTLTFSSDISSIGGTFISAGTNPVTASFTWSVSSPTPQNFMVEVTDNYCAAFSGAQRFGFAIVLVDHCLPNSLIGIVPPDSIFEISGNCSNNNGFPITAITSPTTTTYGNLSINANQSKLLYQANSAYEVQESFWVHFEMNGGLQSDSIWVDITTTSCVWAGDADTNNIVNNFDLLPLGLGYGETGAIRPNAGIDYDCEPALNFLNSTPITGINYKHSDTNGDGIVNADDTTAILLNWGQIHLKNNNTAPLNAIPFYVEPTMALSGQMLQIPIILGDTAVLADSIYGIAFTINYDETMTDTNSVSVDFNTSWLGTINSDMISVQKDFYHQGKIEVAVVRTDQTNRDGMGQIGTLNLTIKDDILRKSNTQRLDLLISNVRIITNIESERLASTPPTDILVTTITSTTDLTAATTYVNVFPNPAKTNLNIQSNDKIQSLQLYTLAGQEIQSVLVQDLNTQLNIQDLAQGIYVLKVQTTQGIKTQKVQIIR